MLDKREQNAIARVQAIVAEVGQWNDEDAVSQRKQRVAELVAENFDPIEEQRWLNEINQLPADMSINKVRLYLETNRDDERTTILKEVYERLELPIPEAGFFPPIVRVMTMHGVKGLEAQVVFIPGLESGILPHEKARKYLGLRLEAARQLYVSITRAKAAIILSYATSRFIQGKRDYDRNPSPFCQALGDKFVDNAGLGLSSSEVSEIVDIVTALKAQVAMNS